jgi:hypothetical protein
MTCSEARRNANRRNAEKSTGPRTSEGKARSSRNALKHGFCATGSALAPLEDRAAYASFTASIVESLRPATPLEEDLARRIADLSWRLRRVPDAEAALLARDTVHDLAHRCARPRTRDGEHDEAQQHEQDHQDDRDEEDGVTPARHLAAAMSAPQNPYLTLQRYEQSLDRARSRALKELRQLQKDRRENPQQDDEPPRRNEPTAQTEAATPSPLEGEGGGEGERSEDQGAREPQRNEANTIDQGPMTPTDELRNEPTPAAPTADPSRPLRAFAPSRLPHPELPNEPNPQSAIRNPQSQIQNQKSQFDRPPQLFRLKPSDLRPIPPTPGPARPASGSHSPAS